jgi:hypothetical protein
LLRAAAVREGIVQADISSRIFFLKTLRQGIAKQPHDFSCGNDS